MEDYPTTKFSDEARIPVGKCFDVITVKDAVLEMASQDFRWDERMTASRDLSVKVHAAENGATITTLFDMTKEAMGQEENRWIDTLYLNEDLKLETITSHVRDHVSSEVCLDMDDSTSYADLEKVAAEQYPCFFFSGENVV